MIFTAFWVSMILGILTLIFTDLTPVVSSLMRMVFFVTPIIWVDRDIGEWAAWIIQLNPFGYFISIVREPLMGKVFSLYNWSVAVAICFLTMLLALMLLGRMHKDIARWI